MGRRRQSLLDDLSNAPWWVGVVAGVVGFVGIAYVLPSIEFNRPVLTGMARGLTHLAPIWLLICLGGAGLSALSSWRNRRLYASQRRSPNLSSVSWQEFEKLVAEHFRAQGYSVSESGGPQPDGGVDLRIVKDGEKYVVQCKNWKARQVGVPVVRELVGSITQEGAVGGFLVTSGAITTPARKLARDAGVQIIDGAALANQMQGADSAKVSSNNRQGTSDVSARSIFCPSCGSAMLVRTARRGKHVGAQFWGCSKYPQCRGVRPI